MDLQTNSCKRYVPVRLRRLGQLSQSPYSRWRRWILLRLRKTGSATCHVAGIMLFLRAFDFNTLRPKQNGRHFADDIFKYIFLNERVSIAIKILLKFVPNGPINNIPALVQIMAWRRSGDKPLSEPMMVSLPTYVCVTRPRCVKTYGRHFTYSGLTVHLSD